ncbi:MAG TPA: hypothetical protein VGN16_22935 [Acidobacteriaceae bacterium]
MLALGTLTPLTILVHGYHPFTEDGGLYAAGIAFKLDPALFPHTSAFVRAPMQYSLFASVMAACARATHLPVEWLLLLANLLTIFFTLFAARQILRRCFAGDAVQLGGLALLAAWWTLPIAGTSLMLMDPYVTARSFSTPLSLLAIAFALESWTQASSTSRRPWFRHPALWCGLCLCLAAGMHLLMAAYAVAFVAVLRACLWPGKTHRLAALGLLGAAAIAGAACLQAFAPPESAALQAAAITRYYWFLSQWHWYEIAGLLAPLAIFAWLAWWSWPGRRRKRMPAESGSGFSALNALCTAALTTGFFASAIALLFAHEQASNHAVARLQPLRAYLLIYALMAALLGAMATKAALRASRRWPDRWLSWGFRALPIVLCAGVAACMALAQREMFDSSAHLELPWSAAQNPNPWVQAFLWIRGQTPREALFAVDSRYISATAEDAHTFRAIALRDVLPDYSKDGGEAAITRSLADSWHAGSEAQRGLNTLNDKERAQRLAPFGVDWVILATATQSGLSCPYNNVVVKVCRL